MIRSRSIKKIIFWLLILWTLIAFWLMLGKINHDGWQNFTNNLEKLFSFSNHDPNYPDHSIVFNTLKFLWQTIAYTIAGTTIGFLLGFMTGFISTKNMSHPLIVYSLKLMMLFIRSFPALIIVLLFQQGFKKEIAIILILTFITWVWGQKYTVAINESTDFNGFNFKKIAGFNSLNAYKRSIFITSKNKFVMSYIFAIESNLRWTTLFGALGVIGIGELLNSNIPNHFENIGIPVVAILIVAFILEGTTFLINKFLLASKKYTPTKIIWQKIIKITLMLLILIITLEQLINANYTAINWHAFWAFFSYIFKPDIHSWTIGVKSINPWWELMDLIIQTSATFFVTFSLGLLLAILSSEKILQVQGAWMTKALMLFVRCFPIFVTFFIFDVLFIDPQMTTILIIGIYNAIFFGKRIGEAINSLDSHQQKLFIQMGNNKIRQFSRFVIPRIYVYIVEVSMIQIGLIFRDIVFFGIFGGSTIGASIMVHYNKAHYQMMFAYVWPIVITLFAYDLSGEIAKKIKFSRKLIFRNQTININQPY